MQNFKVLVFVTCFIATLNLHRFKLKLIFWLMRSKLG